MRQKQIQKQKWKIVLLAIILALVGLFLPLKDIKQGESVLVLTSNAWYSYTVTQVKEVLPTQTEVIAPTENPLLTLYTCSGYADSKRLIVTAVKNPQ